MISSPLAVGAPIPSFSLSDQRGTQTSVPLDVATVLVFYRGFW